MIKRQFIREWILPQKVTESILNLYCNYKYSLSPEDKKILLNNVIFKNKYKGKRCFVIGNGPSLNKVDLSRLEGEITIVMNYFNKNSILEKWQPTAYCAADPIESYTSYELALMKEVPQKIFPEEGYFFPLSVRDLFEKNDMFPKLQTYYLDMHESFELWNVDTDVIDLTKKIIAVQNTAVLGIMLAIYMGCREIFLLGLDHNWLAYPKISLAPHFYCRSNENVNNDLTEKWKYRQNIEAVLTMFRQYEKIHEYAIKRNIEIINVTENSFLDEFPCAKLEDIL
jgi:hypothetical protein